MTVSADTWLFRSYQAIADVARARPQLIDALFAVMVFGFVTLDVVAGGVNPSTRQADPFTYLLLAGQTLPFMVRRRLPLPVMYVMVGSLSIYWMLDYPAGSDASGLAAIYSAVLYGTHRTRTWVHAVVAIAIMTTSASLLATRFFVDEADFSLFVVLAVLMLHGLAAALGEIMHQRKIWLADLQERASRAEAAVETTARLAVAQERTRIAREMHDVVAHGVSVISVQAAAGQEVVGADPQRAAGIFADIEATGREALTEMRWMLGVLRNGDGHPTEPSPQPSLKDLDDAIAHCIEAGLPVDVTTTGQPRSLPPGIELAAYRIIQEALTNALKHGGDATVASVTLHFGQTHLDVTIADTGRGVVSNLGTTGGGNGILGMRERVEAYHGEFTAGARAGGGYQVTARLPVGVPADQSSAGLVDFPARQEII